MSINYEQDKTAWDGLSLLLRWLGSFSKKFEISSEVIKYTEYYKPLWF